MVRRDFARRSDKYLVQFQGLRLEKADAGADRAKSRGASSASLSDFAQLVAGHEYRIVKEPDAALGRSG